MNRAKQIVWEWQHAEGAKRLPYQALRLANGNTLVSLADPGQVVEVTPKGEIARSIGGEQMDIRMGWASGICPLPNGNVLISDYTGRRLLEVSGAGKLVNELRTGHMTVASISLPG